MKTAVDSSVLLDVLAAGSTHHDASVAALKKAYDGGSIVVCEVAWAEVRAHFADASACDAAMSAIGASFDPVSRKAADLAGQVWRDYRKSHGSRSHLIPDFLVGAHALRQADALLTRDRGFYRSYFAGLKIVNSSRL